ncbi:MAG TPA: alpha/beta fold hydrolase [Alphaproteobacteria bacterium]|nr:alpha/beta fold hydrolase [Alphaproteobacteria bacterium]
MAERIPLVLVPGLLCDGALWRHQSEHLGEVAAPMVADVSARDTIAAMAQAVLEQAPPGPFALAGLSMGGYIAFEIMRRAPERVVRLALLDTSARPDTEEQRARRHALIDQCRLGDFKGVTTRLLPLLIHADRLRDEALTGEVMAMSVRVGKEAFLRSQAAIMGRPDSRARLGEIRVPTLVLVGREDVLTPLEVNREMAERIPRAKFVVVEGCGHLSTMERPEAVTAVMRYWLQA